MIRTFRLHRKVDVHGTSGVGIVAEGVVFTDGSVVLRWLTLVRSTVCYASIRDVEMIHGHGARTAIVFDDGAPLEPAPLKVSIAERLAARGVRS